MRVGGTFELGDVGGDGDGFVGLEVEGFASEEGELEGVGEIGEGGSVEFLTNGRKQREV